MNTRLPRLAWSVVFLGILVVHARSQGAQEPFRARTDAVIVDVTVRQGDRSVTDLAVDEFRVSDNGVPQTVQLAATQDIPLDVSLLVENGGIRDNGANMRARAQYDAQVQAISKLLRPGDRLGVVSMSVNGGEVLPLAPVPAAAMVPVHSGRTRITDSLAQALLIPGTPGRRHLIVVATSGADMSSTTAPQRLPDLATRSDALVEVALLPETHPGVVIDGVVEAARATGGDSVKATDIEDAVRQVLGALAHSYVLTYVATGVPQPGWHHITVSVSRPGQFTIGFRRGYER